MDRYPFLYLCNRARRATEIRFNARDVGQWLGTDWRVAEIVDRIERILECKIELATAGRWRVLRIVEFSEIDHETGDIWLVFAPEFRRAARAGAFYSLDVLRRLRRKVASAELYLMLMVLVRKGVHREWWRVDSRLRCARTRYKVMSDIRKRLANITEAWPECPFKWVPRTLKIQCSKVDFYGLVYSRDERAEQRHIDATIDARESDDLDAYLARISPNMARRIKERYVERKFLESDWTPRVPPDIRLRIRESNTQDQRGDAPKRPDTRAPRATPRVVNNAQPSTPRTTNKTTEADNPARSESTKSAGLIDMARARMNRVKRLGEQILGIKESSRRDRKKRTQAPPSTKKRGSTRTKRS